MPAQLDGDGWGLKEARWTASWQTAHPWAIADGCMKAWTINFRQNSGHLKKRNDSRWSHSTQQDYAKWHVKPLLSRKLWEDKKVTFLLREEHYWLLKVTWIHQVLKMDNVSFIETPNRKIYPQGDLAFGTAGESFGSISPYCISPCISPYCIWSLH